MAATRKPPRGRPGKPDKGPRPPAPKHDRGTPPSGGLDRLVLREGLPERSPDSLVAVAKLGKAWGLHGEIVVRLYNEDSDLAWAADAVHLRGDDFWAPWVSVKRWKDRGGKLMVRFDGVHSPQDACALTHLEILVPREDLTAPEDDEVFVHELLGMRVLDERRGDIGEIVDVISIGPNDVWVVRGATESMIPAVGKFVREVDREARVVRVLYEEE